MIKMIRFWFYGSRPFIALHYLFPAALGVFIGYHTFNKPVYFLPCALTFAAIFLSFQCSIILNDIYDIKTDAYTRRATPLTSGGYSRRAYLTWGAVFLALGLIAAAAVGYRIMLIILLGNILHFIYSAPPFRLKRFFPLSVIMLASGAVLAAIVGYAIYEPSRPFLSFPGKAALFIFIPLLFSLNFRDLADYDGDRRDQVSSLFTVLGLNTGRIVNALLVLLSYMAVPIILGYPPLFIAVLPLGSISCYICLKKPFRERNVFYIYFILVVILIVLFNLKPGIIVTPIPR
jgi:4-hydroxybenzoate polyprenyltransferase